MLVLVVGPKVGQIQAAAAPLLLSESGVADSLFLHPCARGLGFWHRLCPGGHGMTPAPLAYLESHMTVSQLLLHFSFLLLPFLSHLLSLSPQLGLTAPPLWDWHPPPLPNAH